MVLGVRALRFRALGFEALGLMVWSLVGNFDVAPVCVLRDRC